MKVFLSVPAFLVKVVAFSRYQMIMPICQWYHYVQSDVSSKEVIEIRLL
jgi:hypothetical protein